MSPPPGNGHKRKPRLPLYVRKRAERRAAARRIAARTSRDLTPEQRAYDPAMHPHSKWSSRLGAALIVVLASGAVHGAVVGVGVLASSGDSDRSKKNERVSIEMRERVKKQRERREEKKKEKEKKKEPEKKKVAVKKRVEKPKPQKVETPEPEKTEQEPIKKRSPRRVVGINMSATVQGGGGTSFAVGNTRAGETADTAVSPEDLTRKPEPVDEKPADTKPKPKPEKQNRTASRIPIAKTPFVLPKRTKPSKPHYPETLKAQGIEADVPVLVTIDATGKVTEVKILKSSGYPDFDQAAREAALAEVFTPALKNGEAVPYRLSFTYRFRLEEQ